MDNTSKVAVVRTDRRRGGVAEALALIADDLRRRVQDDLEPVIIPNLDNPRATRTLHAPRHALGRPPTRSSPRGRPSITIAGGTGPARDIATRDQFDRLGYRSELWNRPATFLDLDPTPAMPRPWTTIRWISPRGEPVSLRLPLARGRSRCRVVAGSAKTHESSGWGWGWPTSQASSIPTTVTCWAWNTVPAGSLSAWPCRGGTRAGILARLAASAWLGMRRSRAECG